MTEIRFYHLRTRTADQALPEILAKAIEGGRRVVVQTADEKAAAALNDYLWVYTPDSFLPHGAGKDGHAADQPIWITAGNDNPNSANVLIATGGAVPENPGSYDLCCEMLEDSNPDGVAAARARWKTYKEQGFTLTYWQQTDRGGWEKKE
jgi:DNA polymerase-3 subunit chi